MNFNYKGKATGAFDSDLDTGIQIRNSYHLAKALKVPFKK
jgi:hypothetical protein